MSGALTPLENEVLTLRDRVFELEEELRALREAVTPKVGWPEAWGLNYSEARVLSALHAGRGRRFNRLQLMTRVYGTDCEHSPNLVSVHICRIRRKLLRQGLDFVIDAQMRYGYAMSREGIDVLDTVIAEEKAATLAAVPLAA